MSQTSNDGSSGAQDAQDMKFHKSLDQHKVYGRVLDMVVCHSMLYQLFRFIQVAETHVLGACTHRMVKGLYIERHNDEA